MAYSQEAIHIKAKSATLSSNSVSYLSISTDPTVSCMTNNNCKAANAISKALRTLATSPSNTCCIVSGKEIDPFLQVALNADVLIDAVILTPIDKAFANLLQTDVEVFITNAAGEQSLCGTLPDYNTYKEVPCNKIGNKIVVKRLGVNVALAMAGLSILSSCDCTKTTFDKTLIYKAGTYVPFV